MLNNDRAFTVPSPLFRAASSFSGQDNGAQRGHLSRSQRPITTPRLIKTGEDQFAGFQFPSEGGIDKGRTDLPKKNITSKSSDPLRRALSHLPSDRVPVSDQLSPVTKILSPASLNGTPRSSGEFYSLSNNSTETLASEHITPETSQMLRRPVHTRQGSSLAPIKMPKAEVLMMGFGQITGSFTLEGSLVNQSPFEEVKRKGIVGGQGGGGMVRSQSTKRDSGILGSFGWGNIGETFGGLLGDSGMSSMKEAKKSSSTKSIPILSAPQSILFVDLQLAPGESRSYLFSHPLPRGIPASYRGKAIKINYNLVIGTQRAAKIAQQNQIKRVEIPFRVFPCINSMAWLPVPDMMGKLIFIAQGDVLGHDLMSPHTLLSNSATVSSLQDPILANTVSRLSPANSKSTSSSNDFSSYVKKLLQRPEGSANSGLLSPTEEESRILGHGMDQPSSMRGRIDLAILNSNASTSSKRNVNRFEINRNGEKVAVIMLSRPAYRLGETVPIVIDLSEADVACYSLHSTLESSESIDPVIALRSKASVQRVTRRIHASHHESTISSHRIHFSPVIPPSATPEFITTGVNLDWNLRFEFVTSRSGGDEYDVDSDDLMEEVSRDERGSVKAAVQGFPCEIFDVAVPLRVYGAVAAFDENMESGSFPI